LIQELNEHSSATETSFRNLLSTFESFCNQATLNIERMSPLALLPPARAVSAPSSKLRGVAIAGIGVVLAAGVMIGVSLWPARQATTKANLPPSAAYKPPTEPATVSAASVREPVSSRPAPPANAGAKPVYNPPPLPVAGAHVPDAHAAGALSSNQSPSNQPPSNQPPSNQPPSNQSPGAGSSMEIVLNATEPAWISMKDQDGQDLFAQLLVPGSARTVNLQGGGTLRTGNAGGLAVRLNGNPIGSLGPSGKIREVRFKNGGFTIIAP